MKTKIIAKLSIVLPLLLATGLPGATTGFGPRGHTPLVGQLIARQGNQALKQIQSEAVRLPAPELPPLSAVEER